MKIVEAIKGWLYFSLKNSLKDLKLEKIDINKKRDAIRGAEEIKKIPNQKK